ncbi:hypothetical protein F4781DRAFT_312879 [Annulohypoxylon bovei var. microspora]|nr:hypothetical protein F4781DRAFT_312879 [Annulohypoxylon bovei var. microspora]
MASIFSRVLIWVCILLLTATLTAAETQENETKLHVAIVGAGITAASTAYHLNLDGASKTIEMTIFEKEFRVGGRIRSHPYISNYVIEAGAPHFSDSDECLVSAVDTLGLHKKSGARPVGLWNGSHLLPGRQGLGCAVGIEAGSGTLQDLLDEGKRFLFPPAQMRRIAIKAWEDFASWTARLWKHGIVAPWRFHHASAEDLDRWKRFGNSNHESFDNLEVELGRAGLSGDVLGPAKEYASLGDSVYSREVVEPCARAVFCQNLDHIRALATVVANDPARVVSLWDGNVRLVKDMIMRSGAILKKSSRVTQIKPGVDRRYYVETASGSDGGEFDVVLLAGGPDQDLSSILSNILPPHKIPAPLQYTETHVTHFSHFTLEKLLYLPQSEFPEQDVQVPQGISGVYFVDNSTSNKPDLLHTSSLVAHEFDPVCSGELECDEFIFHRVHRIVSRSALSDADIARLMGVPFETGDTLKAKSIDNVKRTVWPRAFPVYQKQRDERWENIELAPGLFYLGDGERLHSSMEMGCRMGRNTARLIHAARGEAIRAHTSEEVKLGNVDDSREL